MALFGLTEIEQCQMVLEGLHQFFFILIDLQVFIRFVAIVPEFYFKYLFTSEVDVEFVNYFISHFYQVVLAV